jgi:hypothetical protein
MSVLGHMPCKSGSPQGVFGATYGLAPVVCALLWPAAAADANRAIAVSEMSNRRFICDLL